MKVLVGIMYCIENEFDLCVKSIEEQSHRDISYFVVKNLPNKDAHNKLYSSFMNRVNDCDLFLKIDADMVFCSPHVVRNIVNLFIEHTYVDHMQFAVHDFFTDRLVYGLNVFRNHVTWAKSSEKYFIDKPTEKLNKLNFKEPVDNLVPAAFHCPNPSSFQSFHFGLHKMSKVFQNGNYQWAPGLAISHADNIRHIYLKLQENSSEQLYYALLGAYWAFVNDIDYSYVNFDSIETKDGFEKMIVSNRIEMFKLIENWIVKYNLNKNIKFITVFKLKYKSIIKGYFKYVIFLANVFLTRVKHKTYSKIKGDINSE